MRPVSFLIRDSVDQVASRLRGKFAPVSVLKTELAAGSSGDCLSVSNSLKPKRLSDIEVSPATECSHAGLRFCAGEGGGDEATQYGPVAPDVAVTILEAAHHHHCDVAQPQVDVGPGQPGWQFIVRQGGVEKGIPHLGSAHLLRSGSDHSSAKARAIGVDDMPCQGVAAAVFGGVEDRLDELIRKAALPGDRFACPVEQGPRVPCDQLDEQIVAVAEVAVDVGPRQANLTGNVVHRGLADSVAIDAALSRSQDALACTVCARSWLTA
jgi:hypothetical protein